MAVMVGEVEGSNTFTLTSVIVEVNPSPQLLRAKQKDLDMCMGPTNSFQRYRTGVRVQSRLILIWQQMRVISY